MKTTYRNIKKNKENVLSIIKPNTKIIVLDTETTGLKADAKIIQFSAYKFLVTPTGNLEKLEFFDSYCNPQEPLTKRITEITHITDEMLKNAPTEEVLAPKIFEFLEDSDCLLAYNAKFDLEKLENMAIHTKQYFSQEAFPVLDVLDLARDFISSKEIENYKLETVFHYFYPEKDFSFHNALDDVKATSLVFCKLLKLYIRYAEEPKKRSIHLVKGNLFINPRQGSQRRIRLLLSEGELGDIYYDIVTKEWCCKKTTAAKKLFNDIDLENLESQFLKKYAYPFGLNSVDDVAKHWQQFAKEKKKENAKKS